MRNIAIITSLILTAIYCSQNYVTSVSTFGLTAEHTSIQRIFYMMLHANALHLAINIYSLLTIAFLSQIKTWQFCYAIFIAGTLPNSFLSDVPLVGFSTVIYCLAGITCVQSSEWKLLLLANIPILALQSVLPGIAFFAHAYCFCIGLCLGLITKPVFHE